MRKSSLLKTAAMCAICAMAAAAFTAASALAQETPESRARTLLLLERHGEAVELLENAPPDSLTPGAWYLLGLANQTLLRYEQSLAAFHRADTTSVRTLAALGRSLDALGREREAVRYLAAAYAADSTDQRLAIILAELYTSLREYPKAEVLYLHLWPGDSTNAVLNARLGSLYRSMEAPATAIGYYERSRRANPRNLGVVTQLASVYMSLDLFVSARRVIDAALLLYPKEGTLWIRSGDIAMREEHYRTAAIAYRQALALGDTTADALRNLGISLYMTEYFEEATVPLAEALAHDGRDHITAFYYGLALRRLDMIPEAIPLFELASDLMDRGTLAELYIQLGGSYAQMASRDDAVAAYTTALGLDPARVEVHYFLGRVHEAAENMAEATRHYRTFLSLVEEDQFPEIRPQAAQRLASLEVGEAPTMLPELQVDTDSAALPVDSVVAPDDSLKASPDSTEGGR